MDTSLGPDPPNPPASVTTDERPPARPRPEPVSRFLLLSFGDDAQGGMANPFHLHRAIARFEEAARVTKRSDGRVEIEMKAAESARKLLNADSLSIQTKNSSRTVPITVRPHPTKGFATGVITVPDLEDVDEDDILEELRDQGVRGVRRLHRRENGSTVPTDTLVLSFCQETLPAKVRVAWRSTRVRPYVPNPIRCFKCQAYGHMASSCRGKERCGRCSSTEHKSSACKAAKPRCACSGEHEAWSRDCPKLLEEKRKAKDRVNGGTRRTVAQPPPEPRTSTTEPQSQTAELSTPYRSALTGEVPPPRRTPVPHPVPPLPVVTMESKIQDCTQLSVQQFLALLDNHRCAIGPCKATNPETRDIGVPDMAHMEVQTDPPDNQSVALPEADISGEVLVIEGDDPEETHTEASGKRSREDSPTQTAATGHAASRLAMADAVPLRPSETPTTAKRTRVVPDRSPPPACAVQGQSVNVEEMAISSATLASEPTRGSEGKEVATLQIQIGPPDRPATPSEETPQRTPAIVMSDQNRGRQRISWSGDDQPLMRPPPPPPQPPPISGRLGSVSPAGFFSPVQSPYERSKVGGVSVRSRSAQRPGQRSDGSASATG